MNTALWLLSCSGAHPQSALHPAGPDSAALADLIWGLTGILTVVFVITVAIAAAAVAPRRPDAAPSELGPRFVAISGIAIPTVILFGILGWSLQTTFAVRPGQGAVALQVVGHQFWWEVRYPQAGIVDANHLVLPAGSPVVLELWSDDVIHSLWIPNLHGKVDLLPERRSGFWLRADAPGVWRGACTEYCGTQHARMLLTVEALEPAAFEAWQVGQVARAAEVPEGPGREVFVSAGCAACHAVRGVSAADRGPDLTHVASRPTLAAGVLPNTRENLIQWLRAPQEVKPGNQMPPSQLPDREFEALVDWLGSLR